MARNTTVALRELEVVNICTGEILGCPTDFEFCVCDGKITALLVPKDNGIFGFWKQEYYVIPWCKIECFGQDTILIRMSEAELSASVVTQKDLKADRK